MGSNIQRAKLFGILGMVFGIGSAISIVAILVEAGRGFFHHSQWWWMLAWIGSEYVCSSVSHDYYNTHRRYLREDLEAGDETE